jgi:hypothetical protein
MKVIPKKKREEEKRPSLIRGNEAMDHEEHLPEQKIENQQAAEPVEFKDHKIRHVSKFHQDLKIQRIHEKMGRLERSSFK